MESHNDTGNGAALGPHAQRPHCQVDSPPDSQSFPMLPTGERTPCPARTLASYVPLISGAVNPSVPHQPRSEPPRRPQRTDSLCLTTTTRSPQCSQRLTPRHSSHPAPATPPRPPGPFVTQRRKAEVDDARLHLGQAGLAVVRRLRSNNSAQPTSTTASAPRGPQRKKKLPALPNPRTPLIINMPPAYLFPGGAPAPPRA